MGMILITRDLGVVAGVADRIAVMYAGRIVERGSGIFTPNPLIRIPGLLDSCHVSTPRRGTVLRSKGLPPSLLALPQAATSARCPPSAHDKCVCRGPAHPKGRGKTTRRHASSGKVARG